MPRLTKIYTRKGDAGDTALGTRTRVKKNHLRIEAYGSVDELNAFVGLALTSVQVPKLIAALTSIQNQLFHLGSQLAFPAEEGKEFEIPRIEQRNVDALEALIDELNRVVGDLENFILPGGSPGSAALQVARTVCRRVERRVVALAQQEEVGGHSLAYLNRLSDALFVMARYENNQQKVPEQLWDSHA